MGLVLCPNTALCHQVVRLVSALKDAQGQPLLRACHISSSSPPPFDPPDIVVTTPGALKTLFNDRGAMYGSQWTAEAVSTRAAFVVVDEADLLWQGGYVKDLTRLLDVSPRALMASCSCGMQFCRLAGLAVGSWPEPSRVQVGCCLHGWAVAWWA